MEWRPFLCIFLFVVILFQSVQSAPLKQGQIHRCVTSATTVNSPIIFDDLARNYGKVFNVMGITENCILYTGWLHDVYKAYPGGQGNINGTGGIKGSCKRKQLVMIKTYGNHQKLILAVEAHGRRIMVQSVYEADFAKTYQNDKGLHLNIFRPDRRTQAYSQPLPKGCQIENFFNGNYRIYVLCRSHYNYRLYEAEVYVDAFHHVIIYFRKEMLNLDAMWTPPFEGSRGLILHNMDDTSDTLKPNLSSVQPEHPRSGLAIINDNNELTHSEEYVDVAMSLASVTKYSTKGISFLESDSAKRLLYYERTNKFYMEEVDCVKKLNNMVVYTVHLEKNIHGFYDMETLHNTYSRRRFLNEANFHRRMSRPHAFYSSPVLDIRFPFFHLLGVFIGYFTAILVIIGIALLVMFLRREYKKRRGFKVSSTAR